MAAAEYIIDSVKRIVQKYDTRDPRELCQALHIRIYRLDLQRKLKGYFFYQSRQKNIVIDSSVNHVMEQIILAHELGHAVLHTKAAMMRGFHETEVLGQNLLCPEETEANLFAAELLLDDNDVVEHLQRESFYEAASALYVPAALLDYKAALLRKKGYRLDSMELHRADFLKEDCGAYLCVDEHRTE